VDNGLNLHSQSHRTNIDPLAGQNIRRQTSTAQNIESQDKSLSNPEDRLDISLAGTNSGAPAAAAQPAGQDSPDTAKTPEKEVTVLLYLDGQYPDLEPTMASIPLGLESVGSNKDMNVVVQLARAAQTDVHQGGVGADRIDNDWEGVKRYFINQSTVPRKETVTLGDWVDIARENPENPLIHFVLAELYESQGMKKESEAEYSKAESLGYMKFFNEPSDPKVRQWSDEFQSALQPLRDKDAASNIYQSPVAMDMGTGVDMKHPHNLQDFVAWGMKNYPAKHYVVVLGGHGGAWTGALQMSPSDMGMAIQAGTNQANRTTGRNDFIDAVVFNSCYMGNLESINEMRNASDIVIASEMSAKSSVLTDWPDILGHVQKDVADGKGFDVREFAKDFIDYYQKKGDEIKDLPLMKKFSKEHYLTCAAVDTSQIDNVTASWKKFVEDWKSSGISSEEVFKVIDESKNYPSFAYSPEMLFDYGTLRDLGDIAEKISKSENLPENIRKDAELIKSALSKAIIAEQHTGYDMENSTGLSVWAPTNASDIALMAAPYGRRVPDFVQQTNWDKKLVDSVGTVDQKQLGRFMNSIRMMAQIQQSLRSGTISADERNELEQKMKDLQAEAKTLRAELTLAGKKEFQLEFPGMGEEKTDAQKPEDKEYIEKHIKTSQSKDGMTHGKGVLAGIMVEEDAASVDSFADRMINESQVFDGMSHMSGKSRKA